jgi:hypothetical protein
VMTPFESAVRGSLEDHAVTASTSGVHAGDELSDRATPLSGTQLRVEPRTMTRVGAIRAYRTFSSLDVTASALSVLARSLEAWLNAQHLAKVTARPAGPPTALHVGDGPHTGPTRLPLITRRPRQHAALVVLRAEAVAGDPRGPGGRRQPRPFRTQRTRLRR